MPGGGKRGWERMKLIYVSHPYTGDEEENRRRAHDLTVKLAKKFPKVCFVNPLDTFKALDEAGAGYKVAMNNCLALLGKCEVIILAPGWEKSKGCVEEMKYAIDKRMQVIMWKDGMMLEQRV